ncbi:A/B/D/E cyclin [Hymenopellis radicata]|nr:A/B/D/E cyclin [Hymenopellis radicata]
MSSNIPIRRPVMRTVRNTVKDIENATARAARIAQRTKALASGEGDSKTVAPTKKTTEGRGVLAEVGGPNASKEGSSSSKGKEKETDDLKESSKPRPIVKPVARRPLQTTAGGRIAPTGTASSKVLNARRKFTVASSDEPSASSAVPGVRRQGSISVASTSTSRSNSVKRHTTPLEDSPLDTIAENAVQPVEESQVEVDHVAAQLQVIEEEEQDWIDLDVEDADDPLMVSEYVVEVCKYMKEIEINTLPSADYMDRHTDLDWSKRTILLDWMLQVHSMYRCLPETWFLFVNVFDRVLSMRTTISVSKLQLLGISCFFISTKFEESVAPSINDIVNLAGEQYTIAELLKAEQHVLKILNWDLSYCGPMSWLRRASKADDLDATARTIAKYLLEVASLEWKLVSVPASKQAAACLYLARLSLQKEDWTPTLAHYAGYKEAEILPVVKVLLDHLLLPEVEQSQTLVKKYASKRYQKCSIYMRSWVLDCFPKGAPVNIDKELPGVKQMIQESNYKRMVAHKAREREERRKVAP